MTEVHASQRIQFWPEESRAPGDGSATDPDVRLLSDRDLQQAADEGKSKS